ncbi:ureidoglycolate lyase [Bordetella sp. N]|uniref:ureidoglycolate lyase n=1 Tax=Bordetella sp. N TaxID=1746199 RepID=UPI0012E336EB|nr:ureidoglycolate lyase [Bordetella sp. N]
MEITMHRQLAAQALDASAFASFGEVLENRGDTRRRDFSLQFAQANNPRLWVNRLSASPPGPVLVNEMERHPNSAQTFVPMHAGRCLVVVALSDEEGNLDGTSVRAFITDGSQGVTYRPNVWHYSFTSLDGPNEVVVIMGHMDQRTDTEVRVMHEPVHVSWARSESDDRL